MKRHSWNPVEIEMISIKADFHDLENNMTELSKILYELYESSQTLKSTEEIKAA